jgi:hypothetical protein
MQKPTCIIVFMMAVVIVIAAQENDFPTLTGPYLGQKPPGSTPELFAPEIFKQVPGNSVHSAPSFTYDGKEMLYTVMPVEGPFIIKYMRMIDNTWSKPDTVVFPGKVEGHNSLFANDNDILLFKAKCSRHDEAYVASLWRAERENSGWGTPVEMDSLFDGLSMGVSITRSGTIYFTLPTGGSGSFDIFRSTFVEGKYAAPEKLGPQINSDHPDWQPFVAPDESYLIFSRYKGKPKSGTLRLFISFRDSSGNWTEARDMGESINEKNAGWPYVSPDGKYFFFVSSRDNDSHFYKVYWVSAKILEDLKPMVLKN